MTLFAWAAPLCKLASRRWSPEDFEALASRLRQQVPPGGIIADLGGGTGELGAGIAAALRATTVIIDPTPQMLRRVDGAPIVSVCLAQAEALPFPNGYFDALLCCDVFHHVRDQAKAAAEIARVVRPGGGVLILDFDPSPSTRWWTRIERLLGEPAALLRPQELEELLSLYGVRGHAAKQGADTYIYAGIVTPSL